MSIRRALSITVGTRYLELLLALVSSIVLARLLTPEDFGIFSIAASVAGIGYLLRNFGVGQYLVQAETLEQDQVRAAFSLTLGASWLIALLLLISAPWLAGYYGEPGISTVLLFLSLNFMLLPFGAITDAVLHRNMQFGKLGSIRLVTGVVSLLVGVGAAMAGAGYLAIAWSTNAATLATILMTLVYRPAGLPWLPGIRGIRRIFAFGIKVGTLNMVNKGSDAATELLIGKAHGLHDLGIYSRAFGAFMLFENAIIEGVRPVILPMLSENKRRNAALGPVYLKIISLVSGCMVPFFTFLYLSAADLIQVLYGDQWGDAVPVLHVLCLAGLFIAPTSFFEQLLIAHGRPGKALQVQTAFQGARLIALLLLLAGPLHLAALAFVAGGVVKMLLVMGMSRHYFRIEFSSFMQVMGLAVLLGGMVAASLALVQQAFTPATAEPLRLLVNSLTAGATWLAGVFLLRHPFAGEIRQLYQRLRQRPSR